MNTILSASAFSALGPLVLVSFATTGCIDPAGLADGEYGESRFGPTLDSELGMIAVGGTMVVEINSNDSQNAVLSVEEGPFAITDMSRGPRDRVYLVQAVGTGGGRLRLSADGFATNFEEVAAREVETVAMVPTDNYQWDPNLAFAVPYDRPQVSVLLLSASGQPMHDASISITVGDDVTQTDWDTFSIAPGRIGYVPFSISADSFGSQILEPLVAGSVDRIEVVPQSVENGLHNICFHAFISDVEVLTYIDVSVRGPATEWGSPCTNVRPYEPGEVTLTARAMNTVVTHELNR